MLLLVRGKITPEAKITQPLSHLGLPALRGLRAAHFRWLTLTARLFAFARTWYPFSKLGKEFMRP